ncbi:sialidase family protein [Brachyspira pilosicoli]|uniref:sialidase family protein n=1 Tax=Brachyspira pilosicoli TaxID=52584 RepID=UPI00249394B8|nr:sialidase family protein [Brachyspira pilosicoli]
MFKKYIILLILMLALLGCGTDYMLSSFYTRNDFTWPLSPSQQTNLNYYTHIVGGNNLNEYNSPAILVTPDNYILALYENRTQYTEDIFAIDGQQTVNVKIAISKNATSFTIGKNVSDIAHNPTYSRGSPIGFVDKNGDVVVLAVGGIGFGTGDAKDISDISVSISTNNGTSWTEWTNIINTNIFKPLLDKGYNRFYTTSGRGITLQNGALVCMIDYKKHTTSGYNPEGAAILYSTDNGINWQIGATMEYTGAASGKRFAKVILERKDGKLLIAAVHNTLNDYNAKNSLYWGLLDSLNGKISDFTVSGLPNNSGGNIAGDKITFTKNGQLTTGLILVHSTPDRIYKNPNGVDFIIKNAMSISISEDDGSTWTLIKDDFGTPPNKTSFRHDLKILKDGSIVVVGEEGKDISIATRKAFNVVYRRMGLAALSDGKYVYEGI